MTVLQEKVTNHRKVRRSRAARAERCGKRRAGERVRYDPMKASESEPLKTCRNAPDDIKTRSTSWSWDKPGGDLSTAQAVSGMEVARARVRLLCRTWEPVVSRETGSCSTERRPALPGKAPSGRNRKESCTDARHRGGPPGSSDEGPVMGLERSGRAIQARTAVNHEPVRGAADQATVEAAGVSFRSDGKSRMTGDCHVRICESGELGCPPPLDPHPKPKRHKRGGKR